MSDRRRDFIDVLERAVKGGVLIETEGGGGAPWETGDASVWLNVTIGGVTVIKVDAGLAWGPLLEDGQIRWSDSRDD